VTELRFEWDDRKAAKNRRDHGVTFDEAKTVLGDDNRMIQPDVEHSTDEERCKVIGFSDQGRLLLVIITERHEAIIRLISARRATRKEETGYARQFQSP